MSEPEQLFELPSLGADMERGTLLQWHVAPGDRVERGQVVALVSTEKADVDVEIWQAGTVAELLVEVGVEIPVGTAILRLGSQPTPPPLPDTPAVTFPNDELERKPLDEPHDAPLRRSPRSARPASSPYARRLAADAGIDLSEVQGSGPGGAVVERDIVGLGRRVEREAPSPDRTSTMRRSIAARMSVANREIPHYYLDHDVDFGAALAWLERRNAERPVAERVLPAALVLSAVARAAAATPELNGFWMDDGFAPAESVDIAVVVSLRTGGLVTPKIADADNLSVEEVMEALTTIVAAARRGALRSSWMDGAGLTVSNLGERGVDRLSGIVFPPQVALVGAGGIRPRPWVVDGAVVPRPLLSLSLAADHRASDGVVGSRFLTRIAEALEQPEESWQN